MPRAARVTPGGMLFHVLTRGSDRREIFDDRDDWHFLLWPVSDGDLGAFMQRLTTTHVRRWHLHRHSVGRGHLYQGTGWAG